MPGWGQVAQAVQAEGTAEGKAGKALGQVREQKCGRPRRLGFILRAQRSHRWGGTWSGGRGRASCGDSWVARMEGGLVGRR